MTVSRIGLLAKIMWLSRLYSLKLHSGHVCCVFIRLQTLKFSFFWNENYIIPQYSEYLTLFLIN